MLLACPSHPQTHPATSHAATAASPRRSVPHQTYRLTHTRRTCVRTAKRTHCPALPARTYSQTPPSAALPLTARGPTSLIPYAYLATARRKHNTYTKGCRRQCRRRYRRYTADDQPSQATCAACSPCLLCVRARGAPPTAPRAARRRRRRPAKGTSTCRGTAPRVTHQEKSRWSRQPLTPRTACRHLPATSTRQRFLLAWMPKSVVLRPWVQVTMHPAQAARAPSSLEPPVATPPPWR